MQRCPNCNAEISDLTSTCAGCGAFLVDSLSQDNLPEDLVLVHSAPNDESARIVKAALEAAGILAWLQHPDGLPGAGLLPHLAVGWSYGVLVHQNDKERADEVLVGSMPTEEELIAEEEADPTSLEEAEKRLK